jgi:hypothetical protein
MVDGRFWDENSEWVQIKIVELILENDNLLNAFRKIFLEVRLEYFCARNVRDDEGAFFRQKNQQKFWLLLYKKCVMLSHQSTTNNH